MTVVPPARPAAVLEMRVPYKLGVTCKDEGEGEGEEKWGRGGREAGEIEGKGRGV